VASVATGVAGGATNSSFDRGSRSIASSLARIPALTDGLPQSDCYVNVLCDAMAVDDLDPCGVYFGTTGGQVYASADAPATAGSLDRFGDRV
jgi:hypothetical protein